MAATAPAAVPLTPRELRGRELYRQGSENDAIEATLDEWATTTSAAALPCASCHGNDGRGRAEGGAMPSDITAATLRRPYTVTTASGRTHGAYDDRSLKKAITLGIDPAGNRLDPVMPRYAMPQRDWEDLLAYLKRLGTIPDPGVSDTRLRLGVILPPADVLPELPAVARGVASAWFDDVNARGGIFGRRVELVFCEQAGLPAARAAALERCIDDGDVFALVASFTDDAERELAAVAEEKEIPLVTSVATNPRSSLAPGRYVREVLAGLVEQSAALVRLAGHELTTRRDAIVVSHNPRLDEVRDAAMERLRAEGFESVEALDATALDFRALRERKPEVLLLLDRSAATQALAELREGDWKPLLLVPAAFSGTALVIGEVPVRTFVSVPSMPNDLTAEAHETYKRLVPKPKHRAVELATLASASLMVDALSRAGRVLTRDALIDALDTTWRYNSGFGPQITFRRDRHIGSTGCHVMMLRPGEEARSLWVDAGK